MSDYTLAEVSLRLCSYVLFLKKQFSCITQPLLQKDVCQVSSWFLPFGNEKGTPHQDQNQPNSPATTTMNLYDPWTARRRGLRTQAYFGLHVTDSLLATVSSYLAMQYSDLLTMDLWWKTAVSPLVSFYRPSEKLKRPKQQKNTLSIN